MAIPFKLNDKKAEPGRMGFGTTESVDALLRKLNSTADTSVLVAVNIATLARNAADNKNVRTQDIVLNVQRQVNQIANEIADVCHNKWKDKKHHIIFYLASTEKAIPKDFRRPSTSPSAILVDTATTMLGKVMKSGDQEYNGVFAHIRLNNELRVPSYKGITEVMAKVAQPGIPFHMISHMPMDFHAAMASGRDGWLYRSHTGEVVHMTPDALGQTVFKDPNLPFYPITHVLMGDRYLMKPALGLKDRRQLQAYANKEKWSMHTNVYVRSKIKSYNFALPYEIG